MIIIIIRIINLQQIEKIINILYIKKMRNIHKVHIDENIPENDSQNSEIQKNDKVGRIFQKLLAPDQTPMQPQKIQKELEIKTQIKSPQALQISFILYKILNLSNIEQTYIHQQANKLGISDIKKQQNPIQAINPISMSMSLSKQRQICKCCGYVKQQQSIPLCTSFQYFPCVGISTYLFFQTIKNLIYLHILIFLIHGVYALVTNLYCAGLFSSDMILTTTKTLTIDNLISWVSLDSKIQATIMYDDDKYDRLYLIEMWIGVCLVVLWSLFLFLIRYYERKYQVMVDKETVSAADFSIIIENYPKHLTQKNLQQQLNKYAEELQQQSDIFQIQKINLSVSTEILPQKQHEMYQLQQMNNQYIEEQEKFSDWLCQYDEGNGFPYTKNKRWSQYKKFLNLNKARKAKSRRIYKTLFKSKNSVNHDIDITQNIDINNSQKRKTSPQKGKTIAVITFKNSTSKDIITKYNSIDLPTSIRDFLTCNPKKNKFQLVDSYNYPVKDINIYKAPQPEDIKWQNLSAGNKEKILRKSATYLVTLILLSISFVLVYLLSSYQASNSTNVYLGFAISIIISVINFTIGILIRYLTFFQKDYTETGYQTSLAVKSIWAQLLNSIVVPIIVHYIIQSKNIYGVNGLSTDVIYLGITNSFLPPLTKLIDPYYRYVTLKAFYIRTNLKSRLLMEQIQFNKSQQLMEFQTGYQYIYFINLYLFTSYFVTLQPSISIFAILGMFMMYWLQKYSLLNRMSRPVPGTDLINTAMSQMINLGPIFFAVGALSWSHILQVSKVQQSTASYYIPNILAGSLAALFFIFPFNVIFGKYLPNNVIFENLIYNQHRFFLNSQYDRTNPATMEEAIRQYDNFLEQFYQQTQKLIPAEDEEQSNHQRQIFPRVQTKKQIPSQKQQKTFLAINNAPLVINQSFVRRRKQCIRNRIKLRSKLNSNHFPGFLPQSIVKQIPRITELEEENSKTHLDHIQQNDEHIFKKIDSQQTSNGILDKKQLSQDNKNQSQESEKENIIKINILKTQPIKIKKQKQHNPNKIDFDFKESFPYFKNQIQDQTPQGLRDQKYLNYFGKNKKFGFQNQQITEIRTSDRYQNNPYDSVFK